LALTQPFGSRRASRNYPGARLYFRPTVRPGLISAELRWASHNLFDFASKQACTGRTFGSQASRFGLLGRDFVHLGMHKLPKPEKTLAENKRNFRVS
jgi:hypothetical protein